jgi:4-hydroxy-L-threonine phosphate dehydrogenase PdxA
MEWIIRQVWVKSEPDHGTAYDIAGKGIADHNSLKKRFIFARYLPI